MGGDAKSGGGGTESFNYFGTIVGLVCTGPVSGLWAIISDGKQIWPVDPDTGKPVTAVTRPAGHTDANGAYVFEVTGFGSVRFYWGSATQLADPILNAAAGADEPHPPYRGWCCFVLDDVLLGQERQEPPNLEFLVERAPYILNPAGTATVQDVLQDGQANPLACVQEALLDSRFGFDLGTDTLTEADWAAALSTVAVDNRNLVSVFVDSQMTARELAADLGDYGEFRVIANGREFGAVAWRREGQDINPGSLPIIAAPQLADMAKVKRSLPASLPNQWNLVYEDRGRRYGRDAVRSALLDARSIPGGLRPESLNRPWITIRTQARGWLESLIVRRGRPRRVASLQLRRGFASTLRPGSVFRLDVDVEPGGVQIVVVMRVDRIVLPAGNRPAQVQATEELSFAPVTINIPVGVDATPYIWPAPFTFMRTVGGALDPAVNGGRGMRALEAPPVLSEFRTERMTTLAARLDETTLGHGAYVRTPGGDAVLLGWQRQLAVRAELYAALAAGAPVITIQVPRVAPGTVPEVRYPNIARDEYYLMGANPGPAAAANNDLLLILVECVDESFQAVRSDTAGQIVEFCSIEECVPINTVDAAVGQWELRVLRARLGWVGRDFTVPRRVEAWVVRRLDLPAWQHLAVLPPASRQVHDVTPLTGETFEYRLVPFNSFTANDVLQTVATQPDYPGPAFQTYSFGVPSYSPLVTFDLPTPAIGAVLAVSTTYDFKAIVTDQDGNLARVEVVLIQEGVSNEVVAARDTGRVAEYEAVGKFTTSAMPGTYSLQVRGIDSTGNINREENGSRSWSTTAPAGKCFPVTFEPSIATFKNRVFVVLSTATAAPVEIWYALGPVGSVPASFNLYAGAISVTGSVTIRAFARKAGLTDSDISQRNYVRSNAGGAQEP